MGNLLPARPVACTMQANIPTLLRELTSADVSARRKAAEILARCGSEASPAAPSLARAASDEDEAAREWATSALEDLGPPRDADLSEIAELLLDSPPDTAYWAATLIGRSETAPAACAVQLAGALQIRSEAPVRERIAWALGRMGSVAATAFAALEATAREPNCPPRLARLCREALQSMDPPPAGAPTHR
jgi:HEAT repeat protein